MPNFGTKTVTQCQVNGLVKVITDFETDRLLGVHIMGPNAGELIGNRFNSIL
jgi:dihydrolipoamide dehydrogenase